MPELAVIREIGGLGLAALLAVVIGRELHALRRAVEVLTEELRRGR